jgi:glucan phosphoethanolaminetransferase (alkaline phosphatase superfamily)
VDVLLVIVMVAAAAILLAAALAIREEDEAASFGLAMISMVLVILLGVALSISADVKEDEERAEELAELMIAAEKDFYGRYGKGTESATELRAISAELDESFDEIDELTLDWAPRAGDVSVEVAHQGQEARETASLD